MAASRVRPTVVPRHLARLHCLQLLRRNKRVHLLLGLLVNLLNFLLPLLRRKGSFCANGFHFRLRSPLDGLSLLHGRFRNASLLPAGRLVRLRCTGDRTGMPRQGLLHTNGIRLRGCTLYGRGENDNHEQASAEGESAFEHTCSSVRLNPGQR
jgi:hypothetical protein